MYGKHISYSSVIIMKKPIARIAVKTIKGREAMEQLMLEYVPLIKSIAGHVARRVPSTVMIDDLISVGAMGLMDAMTKFDPTRGVQFKTYAEYRIKGAMLDELRSLDLVPRSLRQKANRVSGAYVRVSHRVGREPLEEEVAEELELSMEEFYHLLDGIKGVSCLSFRSVEVDGYWEEGTEGAAKIEDPESLNPIAALQVKEVKEVIGNAIDSLPDKARLVVSLYYYEDLTMHEISQVLEITESRISQIHAMAVVRLRGKLLDWYQKEKAISGQERLLDKESVCL